jgi:hypothetical protein
MSNTETTTSTATALRSALARQGWTRSDMGQNTTRALLQLTVENREFFDPEMAAMFAVESFEEQDSSFAAAFAKVAR